MRAPKGSIYLPKQWSKKGKPMGYKEIVSCSEGYSDINIKQRSQKGYQIIENSNLDIRSAVEDFFNFDENFSSNELKELNKIRNEKNVIGFGDIAQSYLQKNSEWFLKS
jgi:hypothetical protein